MINRCRIKRKILNLIDEYNIYLFRQKLKFFMKKSILVEFLLKYFDWFYN